jgi:hypothetical protein
MLSKALIIALAPQVFCSLDDLAKTLFNRDGDPAGPYLARESHLDNLMKQIEAGDGFNCLLRCYPQFGTSGKQESREKRKKLFCGLNRWALISQPGTTVTVQLGKPPHVDP